jgi:molybdopterin converting factor subunit 1
MRVQVKLFAAARELAGTDTIELDMPERATLAELRVAVGKAFPALQRIMPHAMWAVDAEYAGDDHVIGQDSEVALIPPVSGG